MKQDGRSPKQSTSVHCEVVLDSSEPQPINDTEGRPTITTTTTIVDKLRTLKDALGVRFGRQATHDTSLSRCIPVAHTAHPLIDERTQRPYVHNGIRSSRYTVYDFLPKQLLFQCTRLNNFYFIVIGIPQAIPGFSTTGNFTTILPLLFFILLTIFKEGYDDFRRHRLDKSENKSTATVLRRERGSTHNGLWSSICRALRTPLARSATTAEKEPVEDEWMSIVWQDVRVGDIIQVKKDDTFPADVALLSTDDEASIALIETMALDGETNLKPKQATNLLRHCNTRSSVQACPATLIIEQPNKDLYNFTGHIKMGDDITPLSLQQVVLRGSILRNTKYAIGLVINTGEDCKIRMNANHHPKAKKPHLERWSNYIVLTLIAYVVLLSVGSSLGYLLWQSRTEARSWYLDNASVPFKQIIIGYGIMYNNIIPLALYVSLEIVKLAQMTMMTSDIHMFDEETQQKMRCNTNTIIENLGQVDYVLSDKTGTLTENVMLFKGFSVAGQKCLHEGGSPGKGKSREPSAMLSQSPPTANTITELAEYQLHTPLATRVQDFLLTIALCHTCLPAETQDGSIEYQASSPDELALVKAAAEAGYRLKARSSTMITIARDTGTSEIDLIYEILDVIEFSSNRKRMSVLIRYPNQEIWLLTKGADNVLAPRLQHSKEVTAERSLVKRSIELQRERGRKSLQAVRVNRPSVALERLRHSIDFSRSARNSFDIAHDEPARSPLRKLASARKLLRPEDEPQQLEEAHACFEHLEEFASEGLRTLMYARRHLTAEDYTAWKKVSSEANSSVADREARMEQAAETVEHSMELLGVTAIEDKLQRAVPKTIEKLRRANIRIWMLTGDKRETAISIAHSSHICCPESLLFNIDHTKGPLQGQLHSALSQIGSSSIHSVAIVDGHTLSTIEESKVLLDLFYKMAILVDSVICCRASPSQKAALVNGIRKHAPRKLTLTIGDGANDVAMIQAAHVGVGMMGREGMQAARVADYCIAQFSFLQRLLLVHGRWNYLRTARFILNTFWKEMLFYLPQTLYQASVGFSGSSLYENWSLTALNTLFTSLCVILPGIFEQDLKAETLLAVPELYVFGQKNSGLNMTAFVLLMASAVIEGMIVWHVPYKVYGIFGVDNGAFALGHMVFSLAIIWTNWKLLLIDTHTKTKIILGGFFITVAGWWVWSAFLSGVYSSNLSPFDVRDGFFHGFGRDLAWWATVLLTLTILMLTDLVILALRRYLIMHGHWPLWPATAERRYQARELEAWQEVEHEHFLHDHDTVAKP